MSIEAMKQALDELESLQPIMANGLLEQRQLDFIDPHIDRAITTLRAAIKEAEKQAPALVVPDEVARTLTTTDIAWLSTHRLTNLWFELGQVQWMGVDEGWNLAIEAVRKRLNDECQAVLDWKARADQSNETAIKLLRKMQQQEKNT